MIRGQLGHSQDVSSTATSSSAVKAGQILLGKGCVPLLLAAPMCLCFCVIYLSPPKQLWLVYGHVLVPQTMLAVIWYEYVICEF